MKINKFKDSFASLFTLENKNGVKVVLTDIGADIVSIIVPDKDGNPVDIALGYDEPDHYMHNMVSYGAIVGRFANRIGGAKFTLNGVTYQCDVNDNANCLHGGDQKYYDRMWFPQVCDKCESVTFSLFSPDGDQSMPGNATITVTYTLDDENALKITYTAVSDKDTYFNLTNHNYFNLNGEGSGDILDQKLELRCSNFTPVSDQLIPTGEIRCVKGTPMDFTTMKVIGDDIASDYEQVQLGNGFDHNFVLDKPSLEEPFAIAKSDKTGIVMAAYTDLPAVQFYSGNFMGSDPNGKNGRGYKFREGFCLETQYYPDTPNHPDFPSDLFKAGEKMVSSTIYKFCVEK